MSTDHVGYEQSYASLGAVGTDYNNDRAVDLVVTELRKSLSSFENPREGKFLQRQPWPAPSPKKTQAVAVLDFDHDGWMDLAFTHCRLAGHHPLAQQSRQELRAR